MRRVLCIGGLLLSVIAGLLCSALLRAGSFAGECAQIALVETLMIGLPALLWHARTGERFAGLRSQLRRPTVLQTGWTLLTAVSATVVASMLAALWFEALETWGWQPENRAISLPDGGAWQWALAIFSSALVPAVCEELLFRGTLLHFARRHMPEALAVFLSAAAFAACHGSVEAFPALLLVGWALGFVFVKTDNLLLCALLHAAYNAVVLVLAARGVALTLPVALLCAAAFIAGVTGIRKARR